MGTIGNGGETLPPTFATGGGINRPIAPDLQGPSLAPSVLGQNGGSGVATMFPSAGGDGGATLPPSAVGAGDGGGGGGGADTTSPSTTGTGKRETTAPTTVGGGGGTTAPSTTDFVDGGGSGTIAPTNGGTTRSGTTNRVSATPFELLFDLNGVDYSDEDADAASEITKMYMTDFLSGQFSGNFGVNVESVQVEVIQRSTAPDGGAGLAFLTTTTFPPDSSFVPEVAELDMLVELAFSEPEDLILLLQELPRDNPFSSSSEIAYGQRSDLNRNGEKSADFLNSHDQDDYGSAFGFSMPFEPNDAAFKITPFMVSFSFNGNNPSDDYVAQASLNTIAFLDDYLKNSFDALASGAFDKLVGAGRGGLNDPRVIGFLLAIETTDGYSLAASQTDVDTVVAAAFHEPFVSGLIFSLQSLPTENPYSETTEVQYRSIPANATTSTGEESSKRASSDTLAPLLIASVVAVGVLVVAVMAVSILLHRGRRRDRGFEKDIAPLVNDDTSGSNHLFDLISDESSQPAIVFRNESLSSGTTNDHSTSIDREYALIRTILQAQTGDPLLRSSWSINEEFIAEKSERLGALHSANRVDRSSVPSGDCQDQLLDEEPMPLGRLGDQSTRPSQRKPLEP